MMWYGDWSGWMWLVMGVCMLAFWTLVGMAVWAVVRSVTGERSSPPSPPSAEELLRCRYAAGDFDDDELARRLAVLRQQDRIRT